MSTSAIQLASETVRSILKIDDIVSTRLACSRPSVSGSVRRAAGKRGKNEEGLGRVLNRLKLIESLEQASTRLQGREYVFFPKTFRSKHATTIVVSAA